MQIFLNEYSLQGQFYDASDYETAVVAIISMVNLIREKGVRNSLYRSAVFASRRAIRDKVIASCFKYISKTDIRENFIRIIFDRGALMDWEDQPHHDPERDDYFYKAENVNGTSMAELAERKLIDDALAGAFINFIESSMPDNEPTAIIKNHNPETIALLFSFDQKKSFEKWMEGVFHFDLTEYSPDSTEPPTDEQTMLRDASRYVSTKETYKGRRIYQEVLTKRFFYVDSLHFGPKAHIEVFDKRGKHLGEADLDGKLMPHTKKRGRTIMK